MAVIGYHTGFTVANLTDGRSFGLGDRFCDHEGNEFCYVQANGAIAQYEFVGIDENYQAAPLTAAMAGDGWMVGAAQVAFADNEYGFICMRGTNVSGNVLANAAADTVLRTSATAGSLDDNTTGTQIDGVVAVTARGTSNGEVEVIMTFPRSETF